MHTLSCVRDRTRGHHRRRLFVAHVDRAQAFFDRRRLGGHRPAHDVEERVDFLVP
jgi:hypothetical protein